MITFRNRMARGQTRTGWLDSRHTFSFANYRDPAQMGFRSLRVINEDRVIPGAGFPSHCHRDLDHPLAVPTTATGLIHNNPPVPNLTRITVQGSTNKPDEWLRLTIDTRMPGVFSWSAVRLRWS